MIHGWATHSRLKRTATHHFRLNSCWIVFVSVTPSLKISGGDKCGVRWHFSPLYHEMCYACWGQAKARLSKEASGRRSSAAHLKATLVRSTREHHLKHSNPVSGGSPREWWMMFLSSSRQPHILPSPWCGCVALYWPRLVLPLLFTVQDLRIEQLRGKYNLTVRSLPFYC